MEDIPERLKENVTVETCSSVTFDMPAAEFHVVCNVQEITFYSTYEPAVGHLIIAINVFSFRNMEPAFHNTVDSGC